MSKVGLLHDSEIGICKIEKQTFGIKENPISKYNYVIHNYNSDYCLVEDIKLQPLLESTIYSSLYYFMRSFWGNILIFLILLVVPFINILLYTVILMGNYFYFAGLSIFKTNLKKNPDPFRNMIFSQEICDSIKNINWGFDIEVSQLDGLSLNQDIVSSLMLKNNNGKIKFMVYNNIFWNYFHDYPESQRFHLIWTLACTIIFLLSIIFYFMYYELIWNGRVWS